MLKKRELLISLRIHKGSRAQIAAELGISEVYLRLLENGTFKPGRSTMIRIACYFGVSAEVLFPDLFTEVAAYQHSK